MRERRLKDLLLERLRSLHTSQSGAVAFLCLAAILIIFMMALIVYDTSSAARQKLEVQAAADAAAWSQSAVEARSMNMITFANVGKRITVGMSVFYEALWLAWAELLIIIAILAVIACVLCAVGVGCVPCEKLAAIAADIGFVLAQEAEDGGAFATNIKDYLNADVKAFDDYQDYMSRLTPWWGFAENFYRGGRNGALVTAGWPTPRVLTDDIGLEGSIGSGVTDSLPIQKASDYQTLCRESWFPDLIAHGLDYAAKTITCGNDCLQRKVPNSVIPRPVLYLITGALAMLQYLALCPTFANATFGEEGKPYEMKSFGSEAAWLRASSNLVFAYRPGLKLLTDWREKYSYLSPDFEYMAGEFGEWLYTSDGYFGMSRGEISFQDGAPNMWHCSWGTRMRPVAFPGEWAGYGDMRLVSAFHDVAPLMAVGSLLGFVGGGMGEPEVNDLLKAELMFDGMNDNTIDGVSR